MEEREKISHRFNNYESTNAYTHVPTHKHIPAWMCREIEISGSGLQGVCGCVSVIVVHVLCVSRSLCVHVSEHICEGKRKCFRGKWINSRIQQRHSKQPSHTPDWRLTMPMYMRGRESR